MMIKNRNLVILAVVLLGLLAINLLQKKGHDRETSRSSTETVLAGTFAAENFSKITLARGQQDPPVVLVSTPDGWRVESSWNARANQQRIDSLLRVLSDLAGEYRSDSADVLADYGLGPDSSVVVVGYDLENSPAFSLEIGNKPDRVPGNFVRSPGENRVFLTSQNILGQMGLYSGPGRPEAKYFYDLQAVQIDRTEIDRIELTDGDASWILVKEFATVEPAAEDSTAAAAEPEIDRTTWEWKVEGEPDVILAKSKADGVLNALVSIRATDVDNPDGDMAAYGLEDPTRTARLYQQDGSVTVIHFGADRPAPEGGQQGGTWMQVEGDSTVWITTSYTMQNGFKKVDDLKAE